MNRGDACLIVWPDGSTDLAEFKGEVSEGHVDVWLNDHLMCVYGDMRVIPVYPNGAAQTAEDLKKIGPDGQFLFGPPASPDASKEDR